MRSWPVQDAKARFSELLEASLSIGPQLVTKRGIETAVLVSVTEWNRLKFEKEQPTLKELLLAPAPRAALKIPKRSRLRHRKPPRL
jgi:antitoxin Phd